MARSDRWFTGITVTNGSGSARTGAYANFTDEQMIAVRRAEQRKAALIGEYSAQIQLGYTSAEAKDPGNAALQQDLAALLAHLRPNVVYLHQPADKHDTHVAVFGHALRALRRLPREARPERVYGCEGWRNLDWLSDAEKQLLDTSLFPGVAAALMGVFDSQNTGGKRFDLAIPARRCANATFHDPHTIDRHTGITWACDLAPLLDDDKLHVADFVQAQIHRFRDDVTARVQRYCP
jgi:LmbE family N-acetylglucosaminyl deacetylase